MYVYVCMWICTCICIYVYDSICWALKRPVHCAEQLLELKICISPQFRAIDPPNPARGFIQQNDNVRLATAACMQKYGNVSFVTVACAKCMRYGGGGGPYHWGGGWGPGSGLIYVNPRWINLLPHCHSLKVHKVQKVLTPPVTPPTPQPKSRPGLGICIKGLRKGDEVKTLLFN